MSLPPPLPPPAVPRAATREPSIDGLRAVCLLAILLYHQPVSWLPGGFLAVSTFFTLSGFLITRLVLTELRATGTVRLGAFAARRLRRLAPAALVTVLATVVAWAIAGWSMRLGDVVAASGYATNWWQLHLGQGYSRLFEAASPLQHFWSLAIEEQFYLCFPAVVVVAHRLSRRRIGGVVVTIVVLTVASFVVAGLLPAGDAYYATPSRIGEILVGSLLALALDRRRRAERIARLTASWPGRLVGLAAAVALLGWWTEASIDRPGLFPFGTLLNAGLSCLLILECVGGSGHRRVLASAPLQAVGRISYAAYLVHWPIYLLLEPGRFPGVAAPAVQTARVVLSLAVAAAMFRLVEEPVRLRRRWRGAMLPGAAAVLAGAAVAVTLGLVPPTPPAVVDERAIDDARAALLELPGRPADAGPAAPETATSAVEPVAPRPVGAAPAIPEVAMAAPAMAIPTTVAPARAIPPATPAAGPTRVLVVGDSTAWSLSLGIGGEQLEVRAFPAVGCGIGGATPIRYLNQPVTANQLCAEWLGQLPSVIELYDPDVVLVAGGLADLSERQLPDGSWGHIGQPAYDAWLADRFDEVAAALGSGGARIGWLTLPHVAVVANPSFTGPPPFAENDWGRAERYGVLIAELAERDDTVELVDFADYLLHRPGGEFAEGLRSDGVHIDSRAWPDVAAYLLEAIDHLVSTSPLDDPSS